MFALLDDQYLLLLFIYEMFELKVWNSFNVCSIRWPVFAIFGL